MQHASSLEKSFIFFFIIAAPFLGGLGIDLYVPSLPIITREFHTSKQLVQLTISVYIIGYGLGQLFLGVLSDTFGRKKIIIYSSVFYVIISVLSALSYNVYLLNLGRFWQGICLGGILSSCRAVASDSFSGHALNKMMTYITSSWALGMIIGPFIGSYLQYFWNWQVDFYFFALYGFILLACVLMIPETNRHLSKFHLSTIFKNIKFISTHIVFLYSTIIASLVYAILVIFNIVGPFLIQDVLKYSVVQFGYIALLLSCAYFLGSILNRFLIHYFKATSILFFNIIASLLISLVMIVLDVTIEMNLYIIFFPTWLLFFFCGMNFPNVATRAMSLFPSMGGITSAIFGFLTAGGTFLLTGFSELLKSHTQLPASLTYAGMLVICLILFIISKNSRPDLK